MELSVQHHGQGEQEQQQQQHEGEHQQGSKTLPIDDGSCVEAVCE
jgi:hypothetical protein